MIGMWLWGLASCSTPEEAPREPEEVAPAPDPRRQRGDGRRQRGGGGNGAGDEELDLDEIRLDDPAIGGARQAFVHYPEGPGPFPVLFAFHGGHGNTGAKMAANFQALFDQPIVLVFPTGNETNREQIGWVGPGMPNVPDEMQDVKFVRRLLERVSEDRVIDRSRVFAAGFSNGGFMTHVLYCTSSELFAGFAMVSRSIARPLSEQCDPVPGRKVMLMWGTADEKIENDHTLKLVENVEFFERKTNCKPRSRESITLPDTGDETKVIKSTWTSCDGGSALEAFEIVGGGHVWPGPDARPTPQKSRDVDATREIARFFGLK